MGTIKDSLTFDDVSLIPQESSVVPNETITKITLHKSLNLQIPLISSAMDTVTESKMAIAIAKMGGIGVIHRNLSADAQVSEIKKVKKVKFLVGAAIGKCFSIYPLVGPAIKTVRVRTIVLTGIGLLLAAWSVELCCWW